MTTHVIKPLALIESELPKAFMAYLCNFDKRILVNTYIWYIKGPKENILVDCGGCAETFDRLTPGAFSRDIASPEEALKTLGLKCADIDKVILTQLHPDHIEYAHKYTQAKFIIQKKELDFGLNPHPAIAFGYVKEWFEDLDFMVIDGDKEIVEGVSVLLTPGHSPGCQSVMVETEQGKAVITGFCCIREHFEPPEELSFLPVLTPGVSVNSLQAYDSVIRVKELADIVIPIHERDIAEKGQIP